MLLGGRPSRRLTKLEVRSPSMDRAEIRAPSIHSYPSALAASAVAMRDNTTPRMVLEGPNSGRPSRNFAPPSSGYLNEAPKIFLPRIGAPLAMASSTSILNGDSRAASAALRNSIFMRISDKKKNQTGFTGRSGVVADALNGHRRRWAPAHGSAGRGESKPPWRRQGRHVCRPWRDYEDLDRLGPAIRGGAPAGAEARSV